MAQCLTPFTIRLKMENKSIPVPCGKCPECRKRRVSGWSFRLMYEERQAISAHFVTLTYDTTYVPITKNGFMTVNKSDVQKFFKRLRKAEAKTNPHAIKYYLAAEYGGRTKRPHYHAIIYNVSEPYAIEKAWMRGAIDYGTVTGGSIGYTLKYMDKPRRIPEHRNDDREPEFGLMSKGLGLGYITDAVKKWHHADRDNRMHLVIEDGKKIAMPRYYKNKIYTEEQRKIIAFFQQPFIEKEKLRFDKLSQDSKWLHNKIESDKYAFAKQLKNFKKDKL